MILQIFRARLGDWRDEPNEDYVDQTFEGEAPLPGAYLETWTVEHMYYPNQNVEITAWFITLTSILALEELLSASKRPLIFYPKGEAPFDWNAGCPFAPFADFALRIYDGYVE